MVTGSPCATHFPLPPGVDLIKLPSATKDGAGRYIPRSLGSDLDPLIALRRGLLLEIQRSFAPDLIVVDHSVLGLGGELDALLEATRKSGTRTILGVRDIIDSPEAVEREWGTPRVRRALTEEYDRICVYGTPEVFDPRIEYPIPPELGRRLEFTGYVVRPEATSAPSSVPTLKPEVLVTVGGGEDGAERVETYLEALEIGPVDWQSTIVLGPLLDPERARMVKRRARMLDDVSVHRFHSDIPRLLRRSDVVVSMAGYNSVTEILQSRTPAVLCPRSFPRREQLIRAERLKALGLVECLPRPSGESLRAAVDKKLGENRIEGPIPALDGQYRLCDVAIELLEPQTSGLARAAR